MVKNLEKLGSYAFIVGVAIALIVGLVTGFNIVSVDMGLVSIAMVILGLIVGALNIEDKEIMGYVIAAIGLTMGSTALANLGQLLAMSSATTGLGIAMMSAFTVFSTFVASSLFIPALKEIYNISKD
ncbi:MAG: hypothetical protein N3D73_00150 [Candidatus Diapherotrites archaeon]|nr:hypothetical protein [Candidatus Diapherotrites archaeon]